MHLFYKKMDEVISATLSVVGVWWCHGGAFAGGAVVAVVSSMSMQGIWKLIHTKHNSHKMLILFNSIM